MTRRSGAIYKSQLQNDLVILVKMEMSKRRIGYSTLAKLMPSVTRDMIRRALGTKEAKTIDIEFTMRILESLGYKIEVQLIPPSSEYDNEQRAKYRKRLVTERKIPNYAQDTVFPVRVMVGSSRAGVRETAIRAVVKAAARRKRYDYPAMA